MSIGVFVALLGLSAVLVVFLPSIIDNCKCGIKEDLFEPLFDSSKTIEMNTMGGSSREGAAVRPTAPGVFASVSPELSSYPADNNHGDAADMLFHDQHRPQVATSKRLQASYTRIFRPLMIPIKIFIGFVQLFGQLGA